MLKKNFIILGLFILVIVVSAAEIVEIIVLKTRLCRKPDFLSSTVANLKRGEKLLVIKSGNGWVQVKTRKNLTGFIHKTAFSKRNYKLTGLNPGKQGASRNEIALAAKGFNKGNEKVLKRNKNFNFRDLEWIVRRTVSPKALRFFVNQVKLK